MPAFFESGDAGVSEGVPDQILSTAYQCKEPLFTLVNRGSCRNGIQSYFSMTLAFRMTTGLAGTSECPFLVVVTTFSMASTTSAPRTTLPNTA